MAYHVDIASEADLSAWGEFVARQAPGNPMLAPAWYGILGDTSSVRRHFLMCRDAGGAVAGICPLYLSDSVFAGRHLTNLEDGWCAVDDGAAAALLDAAIDLRDRLSARYLLLRGIDDPSRPPCRSVQTVRRRVDTSQPADALLSRVKSYRRRHFRLAAKSGYSVVEDKERRIDRFYALYARHMRDLGTPVMGSGFMHSMAERLGPNLRLFLVRESGGQPVGGMLCLTGGGYWLNQYAVVLKEHLPSYANYLLYWSVIEHMTVEGTRQFDLGRSAPGSNTHLFKAKWPGTDTLVPHHFFARDAASIPRHLDDIRGGRSLVQRMWRHLPLALANRLGPLLRRQLPFA
jgi:hypothetical protein